MSRYYGRDGRPITREFWEAKLRDPLYCQVERTFLKGWMVATTWVGWQSVSERVPLIFLVERFLILRKGKEVKYESAGNDMWCERQEHAAVAHKKLVRESSE